MASPHSQHSLMRNPNRVEQGPQPSQEQASQGLKAGDPVPSLGPQAGGWRAGGQGLPAVHVSSVACLLYGTRDLVRTQSIAHLLNKLQNLSLQISWLPSGPIKGGQCPPGNQPACFPAGFQSRYGPRGNGHMDRQVTTGPWIVQSCSLIPGAEGPRPELMG